MPIPTNAQKAIFIGPQKGNGYLILKDGDKGFIDKHNYHKENEFVFYPIHWKGYCTTVLNNEFEKVKSFKKLKIP